MDKYMDLVQRLNAYSAEYQCHGGITAEAADTIEELGKRITGVTAERDAAMKRLCEWCGVGCSMESHRAELCEIAAVGLEFLAEDCTSTDWATCQPLKEGTMPEYIDLGKAIAYLNDIRLTVGPDNWTALEDIPMARARYEGLTDAIEAIVELPAADVRPVVRGKWTLKDWGFEYSECSVCGFEHRYSEQFNFCPNCGADMREAHPDAADEEGEGVNSQELKRTQADYIRSMSDYRLAEFLHRVEISSKYGTSDKAQWLKWLKQEANVFAD